MKYSQAVLVACIGGAALVSALPHGGNAKGGASTLAARGMALKREVHDGPLPQVATSKKQTQVHRREGGKGGKSTVLSATHPDAHDHPRVAREFFDDIDSLVSRDFDEEELYARLFDAMEKRTEGKSKAPAKAQAPATAQAPAEAQAPATAQAPAEAQAPAKAHPPAKGPASTPAAAIPAGSAPAPVTAPHAPATRGFFDDIDTLASREFDEEELYARLLDAIEKRAEVKSKAPAPATTQAPAEAQAPATTQAPAEAQAPATAKAPSKAKAPAKAPAAAAK